jgi:hypothetical protein
MSVVEVWISSWGSEAIFILNQQVKAVLSPNIIDIIDNFYALCVESL